MADFKFKPGDKVRVLAPSLFQDGWTGQVMRVISVATDSHPGAPANYYLARLSSGYDWDVIIHEQRLIAAD